MNIDYLHEFVELAQCLNYTEAARRCHLTQSTLSKHMVSLEKEMGAQLLERDRHAVELTQAGQVLQQRALALWNSYQETLEAVRHASSIPILRVGGLIQNPKVLWILSQALGANSEDKATISCTFDQTFTDSAPELLRKKRIDLAFAMKEEEEGSDSGIAYTPLYEDEFVLVCSSSDPLASCEEIQIDSLGDRTFIRLSGPYWNPSWRRIEQVCESHGFQPRQRPVVAQPGVDFSLIDIQNDVLVLSRSVLTGQLFTRMPQFKCIPLAGEDCHFTIYAAYRTDDKNRALHQLLERLMEKPAPTPPA